MIIQYDGDYLNNIKTQWLQNHLSEIIGKDVDVFNMQERCFFHYTTLDAFWKIVDGETFRANHVRFSNDMQEYKCGEEIIGRIIDNKILRKGNYYVICLCSDGNLLSQWREYGKAGVSIEMDFTRKSLFTINKNPSAKTIKDKLVFSYPVNVLYVNEGRVKKNENLFCERRDKRAFTFEMLKESYKVAPNFLRDEQLLNIIPYIKHGAFIEEKESRLLFSMPQGEENQEIHYVHYSDPSPLRKPYLEVKYGDINESTNLCTYVDVSELIGSNVVNTVKDWLNNYNLSRTKKIMFRFESIKKNKVNKNSQIFISAGSNYEEIFDGIENACSNLTQKPKIWCDSHWPIRSIMVGPTLDKDLIRESIDHYCKSKYWLKYVDVIATETPYREKRN